MLRLDDFYYLPRLEPLIAQLLVPGPGLTVIAGSEPRPDTPGSAPPPNGRTAVFRAIIHQLLELYPHLHALIIAPDRSLVRVPRGMHRRMAYALTQPNRPAADLISATIQHQRPELLIIDRLDAQTIGPALAAARSGVQVLSQFDTMLRGPAAARRLLNLPAEPEAPDGLHWMVSVQRLPTICPHCRRVTTLDERLHERLRHYLDDEAVFYQAVGCAQCGHTGRQGDMLGFDVFQASGSSLPHTSLLSLEEYALDLAAEGRLALEDALNLDAEQLRRTYERLSASESALNDANRTLERRLAQLEAANRVLEQRTTALMALQQINHTLIASDDLGELAQRVCRLAGELCGAERAVLYLLDDEAEILALLGWETHQIGRRAPAETLRDAGSGQVVPFGWPPGIEQRHPDVEGIPFREGLRVPLIAHGHQLGAMVVHSSRRRRFAQGETAILRTLADQAALSIQRAGLVRQLRQKIDLLEAAQMALAARERLEREMELAREVQQSVLPRIFPHISGYNFAARNQPARQVGGDFYDAFQIDEHHFGIVIGDVSGKGMPAALYMALARSLIFAEARREPSPHSVLGNVNQLLCALGSPGMFVTVFYGVVDTTTRSMRYCRAGHDYPLLLRQGTAQHLGGQGVVLGFLPDAGQRLSEETLALLPGDRLVLYTDGMTDALNPQDQRYDLEHLAALLSEQAHADASSLLEHAFSGVCTYQGDAAQFDDMTMLVVALESA